MDGVCVETYVQKYRQVSSWLLDLSNKARLPRFTNQLPIVIGYLESLSIGTINSMTVPLPNVD